MGHLVPRMPAGYIHFNRRFQFQPYKPQTRLKLAAWSNPWRPEAWPEPRANCASQIRCLETRLCFECVKWSVGTHHLQVLGPQAPWLGELSVVAGNII